MITLRDFIDLSMDDYYKINIFNTITGDEILKQVEVGEIEEKLEELDRISYLDYPICSWDIDEITKEFCLNIG